MSRRRYKEKRDRYTFLSDRHLTAWYQHRVAVYTAAKLRDNQKAITYNKQLLIPLAKEMSHRGLLRETQFISIQE